MTSVGDRHPAQGGHLDQRLAATSQAHSRLGEPSVAESETALAWVEQLVSGMNELERG